MVFSYFSFIKILLLIVKEWLNHEQVGATPVQLNIYKSTRFLQIHPQES